MDAIEFTLNYKKYIKEIKNVIQFNLDPVIDKLAETDPHDLATPETWFTDEAAARGFVWNLFINEINEQSLKHITIPIEEINNIEEMELFIAHLYRENIDYFPESSFREIVNVDIHGNRTVSTFSDEESERLDKLTAKCWEIVEKEDINMYKMLYRIKRLVLGKAVDYTEPD